MGDICDFKPKKPVADDETTPRRIGQIIEMDLEAIVGPVTAARYRQYLQQKRSKD